MNNLLKTKCMCVVVWLTETHAVYIMYAKTNKSLKCVSGQKIELFCIICQSTGSLLSVELFVEGNYNDKSFS